jgi:multidrug resistance efflux pump
VKKYQKYGVTGSIVLLAVLVLSFKYRHYVQNPWTRDGQVCADVVQITPRVSGPIVNPGPGQCLSPAGRERDQGD